MPYRTSSDAPPAREAPGLVCSACDVPVDEAEIPRCPKCLRKSTVVAREARLATKGEHGAAWPGGVTCALCMERPIGDEVVYLRVAKTASTVRSATATVFVRIPVCGECRDRVVHHERARIPTAVQFLVGLTFSLGVLVAEPLARVAGVLGASIAAYSLGRFVRENRKLRARLDESGLTAALLARLDGPSGIFMWSNAALHANPSRLHPVITLDDAR
jgi:hypothetical protein